MGQVRKEVAKSAVGEPQPAALGVVAEQHLGDGQANQFRVGEPLRSARTLAPAEKREKVVDLDVKCHDEGVECWFHKLGFDALALSATFRK